MKEKILNTATDLFLNLGFKSVTMDDIAEKLGMSKKTIYSHYPNKAKLIEACAIELFNSITTGIDEIIAENNNPIDELLLIHGFILKRLKEEKASPQFQLAKYYPKVEQTLREKKIERMQECVVANLNRGVALGFYRKDIEVEVVYKFYFMTLEGIKDSDFFPMERYSIPFLVHHFLEYHFRAIASEKGLIYINNLNKSAIHENLP
jgi:AcrR family transcriptional regulator